VRVRLLGELDVTRGARSLALPASKKTRALLAYLCATGRAQHREALCGLLWDGPDDPRAALRWSLTKIRPLLDQGDTGRCRLVADRERVTFHAEPSAVDVWQVRALMASGIAEASTEGLRVAAGQFRGPFLEGLELGGCHRFASWLVAEREALRGAHVAILTALVARLSLAGTTVLLSQNRSFTGPANSDVESFCSSANGKTAAFASGADDLVFGDDNFSSDVFVWQEGLPPQLFIAVTDGAITLTWLNALEGFQLESATGLEAEPTWEAYDGTVSQEGVMNKVTFSSEEFLPARFFRLRRP